MPLSSASSASVCSALVFLLTWAASQPVLAQEEKFDARQAAREILDESNHDDLRAKYADDSLPFAAEVITALTQDLPEGDTTEQYRRIPWIWRIAINATKQNQSDQQRQLLILSLPKSNSQLADWQAVVLGGGLINGLSQLGITPSERIEKLLNAPDLPTDLQARWQRTQKLAAEMISNEKVPSGTRYDALRILGGADWDQFGKLLSTYAQPDIDEELQLGAVCALADLTEPAATKTLIRALPKLGDDTRNMAIALLVERTPQKSFLRDAIQAKEIPRDWLTPEQLQQLDD